jgi:hypothetical protein
MRRHLLENAIEGGRSLSQEAEYRLEVSRERRKLLNEVLVLALGPRVAGLTLLIGFAMDVAISAREVASWQDWTHDAAANQRVAETLRLIADLLARPSHVKQEQQDTATIAEDVVDVVMRALTSSKVEPPGTPIAEARTLLSGDLTRLAHAHKTNSAKRRA